MHARTYRGHIAVRVGRVFVRDRRDRQRCRHALARRNSTLWVVVVVVVVVDGKCDWVVWRRCKGTPRKDGKPTHSDIG